MQVNTQGPAISNADVLEKSYISDLYSPPSEQSSGHIQPSVQGVECDLRYVALSFAVVDALKSVIQDRSLSIEQQESRIEVLYRAAGTSTLQLEFDSFIAAEALVQTSVDFGMVLTHAELCVLHISAVEEARSDYTEPAVDDKNN